MSEEYDSAKEITFRRIYYAQKTGYLNCLTDVFEILAKMHGDFQKWDRHQIDYVWEKVKELEHKARMNEIKTRI